mmetsp:Transcript_51355/g.94920  ORF Transcript_51355/g.94920 Transcript_51355/m.94920 type:complete len:100 (+) Transcript_51355:96-395(+)
MATASIADTLQLAMVSGVDGALCLDQKGFTVGKTGFKSEGSSLAQPASLRDLAASAAKLQALDDTEASKPVVVLETSMRTVSVAAKNELTLATVQKHAA